jgi:hypothetical protein
VIVISLHGPALWVETGRRARASITEP